MPSFPWITVIFMFLLCFGIYYSCEHEKKENKENPFIRNECRNGQVWIKWRSQDYWQLSGSSEGKPPTRCDKEENR